MARRLSVPLFPLPNVVHFPHTDLKLHVFEPRYKKLVSDLRARAEDRRLIGMVVLKPSGELQAGNPAVYSAGTAGLLVDVQSLPDGRSNILLRGHFRFEIDHELLSRNPYREAMVRQLDEPRFADAEPAAIALRREVMDLVQRIAEVASAFPVSGPDLKRMAEQAPLEEIVNFLSANLTLPVIEKLQLLCVPLPERGRRLLGILRARKHLLDLLRPYRHLAQGAERN